MLYSFEEKMSCCCEPSSTVASEDWDRSGEPSLVPWEGRGGEGRGGEGGSS